MSPSTEQPEHEAAASITQRKQQLALVILGVAAVAITLYVWLTGRSKDGKTFTAESLRQMLFGETKQG